MKKNLIIICLLMFSMLSAQEHSFVPKHLKEITLDEILSKPFPEKIDNVYYADGTKTTLKKVLPILLNGAVVPQVFVDEKGEYKFLVILGGHYSSISEDLTIIPVDELAKRGVPEKLNDVYFADGRRTTLEEAKKLFKKGKAHPQMFVDKKGNYKALVLELYPDDYDPYSDIENPSGKQAQLFVGYDINGKRISLKELKGKVVVMNFWFTRCAPCITEMPDLNKLVEKYKNNKDVVFLGITFDKKDKVKKFLKETNFKYKVLAESKEICDLYDVSIYPTHFVIDKNSKISYFAIGGGKTIKEIENAIDKNLK